MDRYTALLLATASHTPSAYPNSESVIPEATCTELQFTPFCVRHTLAPLSRATYHPPPLSISYNSEPPAQRLAQRRPLVMR